jgi:ABC-2 type transport system ATP-binding protein
VTTKNIFVSLQNVTKTYGSLRALDNISLDIKEGEIFGYIGPNGAGKTTTMKILVGLISDFSGAVIIGGCKMPKEKEEIHKLLGYLPQNVAFQEWRTINHALRTFGRLSGMSSREVETRIPEILNLMGLSDVRNKKILQLSGGMSQKVGLAQALLHNPKLLVLDEPLGGLDPLSRHQFKEIVLELKQKGTTILFSSHILSDVQDVADRIGILSHGKIVQIGSLNDLKQRFSTEKIVEVLLPCANDQWPKLSSAEGVKSVNQPTQDKVLLTLNPQSDPDESIYNICKLIVELGIRIRGISLLSASLDEIYLNYVQEAETQ